MMVQRRIEIAEVEGVTLVRFLDRKILDPTNIQQLGEELFALVEQDQCKRLLLSFCSVEFLSSSALNKLIVLDKKLEHQQGKMKLCCLRPEIREVLDITRLDQLFDIQEDEATAIQSF